MSSSYKNIFLIDGIGALVSAFLLGIVLTKFESVFGMPKHVLHGLAFAASVFAVYSISCYLFFPSNWKPYLKIIAFTNLMYCFITIGLMIYFHSALTLLGFAYFIGELVVLAVLITFELRTVLKKIL